MPFCSRVERNLKCRYWCRRNWVFCHNYYDGDCRNVVVDYQCGNGWHITKKRYQREKIAEQFSADRESKRLKSKRDLQSEEPSADDVHEANHDPRLEIYLSRFGYKPDEMPDRREIEKIFFDRTYMKDTAHREQVSESEFTYEEYSEAFQYIVDTIVMRQQPCM